MATDLENFEFENGPFFVAGNLSSGTTLLQSLLDDHPELCVIPVEMKFFKFARLPSLSPHNTHPNKKSQIGSTSYRDSSHIIETKREILEYKDIKNIVSGESVDRNIKVPKKKFNREAFENTVSGKQPDSLRGLYVLFLKAFHKALKVDTSLDKTCFVEKTPHLEEYAEVLSEWFPKSKFLHTVRNPYANMYSLRKREAPVIRQIMRSYRFTVASHYFMYRNKKKMDHYHITRFEDVIKKTEYEMKKISKYLCIPFEKSMVNPTICGKAWGGNPKSVDDDFSSIDERPLYEYKENIPSIDIYLVNKYLSGVVSRYGYEKMFSSKMKSLIPSGIESPVCYLRSRYAMILD